MPYVSSLSHYVRNVNSREAHGVGDAQLANPQLSRNPFVKVVVEAQESRPQPPDNQDKARRKTTVEKDRRKVSQRIRRQTTLFECRSGGDRRHRNQREDDIAEHIDVLV